MENFKKLWNESNRSQKQDLIGDSDLADLKWDELDGSQKNKVEGEIVKLKDSANLFVKTHKEKLIGRRVDVGESSGTDNDFIHVIVGLESEIIEFDGDLFGEVKIILDGSESSYIHEDGFQDFLNGIDVPAYIKSSYKGGSVQLLNEKEMNLDRSGTDLESAKQYLIFDIAEELKKIKSNNKYEGTDEEIKNGLSITDRLKNDFGFDWEDDDKASAYFSRASLQEIYEYMLSVIIPKLKKLNKIESASYNEILKELNSLQPYVSGKEKWFPYKVSEIDNNAIELVDSASDRKVWFIFDIEPDYKRYIGVNWMQGIDYKPTKEDYSKVDSKTLVPVNGSAKTIVNGAMESIKRRFEEIVNEGMKKSDKKYLVRWDAELYDNAEPFIGTEDEILVKIFGTKNVVDMSSEDMKWVMNFEKEIEEKGKSEYNLGLMGVTELTVEAYFEQVENFINEYKDYLIGKKVKLEYPNDRVEITNINEALEGLYLELEFEKAGIESSFISKDDLSNFIDGESITNYVLGGEKQGEIELILQDENKEIPEELKDLIGKKIEINDGYDLTPPKPRKSIEEIISFSKGTGSEINITVTSNIRNDGTEIFYIYEEDLLNFKSGKKIESAWGSYQLINESSDLYSVEGFIKEYQPLLIGQYTTYGKGETKQISGLTELENNYIGINFKDGDVTSISINDAKDFLDFKEIKSAMGDISLLEKNQELTLNHPEFRYYIRDADSKKIKRGFEYKEPAREEILKLRGVGYNVTVMSKTDFIERGIDVDDPSNWDTDINDGSIIQEATKEYNESFDPSDDDVPNSTEILFWYLSRKIDRLEASLSLRKMKSAEDALNKVNKIFTQLKKQR